MFSNSCATLTVDTDLGSKIVFKFSTSVSTCARTCVVRCEAGLVMASGKTRETDTEASLERSSTPCTPVASLAARRPALACSRRACVCSLLANAAASAASIALLPPASATIRACFCNVVALATLLPIRPNATTPINGRVATPALSAQSSNPNTSAASSPATILIK